MREAPAIDVRRDGAQPGRLRDQQVEVVRLVGEMHVGHVTLGVIGSNVRDRGSCKPTSSPPTSERR
jgi:hypothetical protein